MSMSSTQENPGLSDRVDVISRELVTLRRCHALGAADADPTGEELAGLERCHVDLRQRAAQIDAASAKPDQSAVDALESDLRGLSDAVRRWIERQDVKTAGS
jgi:hypothetical protein